MNKELTKQIKHQRRHKRVRAKIFGTKKRPRMSVHKSNTGLYVQLIDDESSKTLVSAHTKELKDKKGNGSAQAQAVGKEIAKRAKEKKITSVVFDKGGYKYHGRIKAVADAAREGGLKF